MALGEVKKVLRAPVGDASSDRRIKSLHKVWGPVVSLSFLWFTVSGSGFRLSARRFRFDGLERKAAVQRLLKTCRVIAASSPSTRFRVQWLVFRVYGLRFPVQVLG